MSQIARSLPRPSDVDPERLQRHLPELLQQYVPDDEPLSASPAPSPRPLQAAAGH